MNPQAQGSTTGVRRKGGPPSAQEPPNLTPRRIVEELDRHIVGQRAAKRAVAIAVRNRWRRQQVPGALQEDITPKNIIMIGPTGIGKTEIARRLARLVAAPFVKLEASKFTEVGYVGRDVDAMVRDLVDVSVKLVRDEEQARVKRRAQEIAEERLVELLMVPAGVLTASRDGMRAELRAGHLSNQDIELEVPDRARPTLEVFSSAGLEQMGFDMSQLQKALGGGQRRKRRRLKVPDALSLLAEEESDKLIDTEHVQRDGLIRAEQSGIIFLDEIDKIAGRGSQAGPDVSREGVQRDLLPIVEGSTVMTKYGPVKTDHILFIAAGAFHVAKPSDLIPELQGRFPIRVELEPLSQQDLLRVLTEPESSILRQYEALLLTEGVRVSWRADAVEEIAHLAAVANERLENIGARRLATIVERVLDELSFEAPDLGGDGAGERLIEITPDYVRKGVASILEDQDLSRYIL